MRIRGQHPKGYVRTVNGGNMGNIVNDSHIPSVVSEVTSGNAISPYAKVYVRKNKKKGGDVAGACGPDMGGGTCN